ncbi:PREDICTED: protein pelota [Nicrophorus vespilloides]|uniref:Protein pelota homolog n=1 Tax=Nicrophorus vespilloides TaxID=110193 RepID=A0ABM1NEV0_NICVS|nr:PREDICTED: protein pelota [Nicrophorus vespilloides]
MKLVHKYVDRDGKGDMSFIPEEMDDIWHAYNLITEGDVVRASTVRKVNLESSTGSGTTFRTRTTLTVSVESIDYDAQGCKLRVKGRNMEENEYVKMGCYHTLDLVLNRKFTLMKMHWDSVALERVEIACNPTQSADVAAVIMQEGLAFVCLITSNMTLMRTKIDVSIPRKRKGFVQQYEKGISKFYDTIIQAILRHVNFDVVKCVLVASPGFVKDQFHEYMIQQAIKTDNKVILDNKAKFMLIHSTTGFKHSLQDVLQDPAVVNKIADTKAAGEVKALEQFYTTLQCEPAKAFYGKKHIEAANESQAIETLLISDSLFRSQDVNLRKEYVKIVDSVRESGGDVKIFSSLHPSGERLEQLTGLAAILRFPMPELDEDDEEDSETEE